MTGFARVRKSLPEGEITVSLKSVNHRGLDMHFHLPQEFDPVENEIRSLIKSRVARGHLQIHVSFVPAMADNGAPLNRPLLEAFLRAFREARDAYQLTGEPDLNAVLRVPGMLTNGSGGEAGEDVAKAVVAAVGEAVAELNAFREREGAAIAAEMRQRSESIGTLVDRMEVIRSRALPLFHKRLKDKLDDLLRGSAVDPQRLAQEAALLADRSDVSEELVRLRTHAAQLDALLNGGGEIGKRLDFLLQEMNRESNTVLSKTGGLGELGLTITELALAAKSEIDKIREQGLNVE